MGIFSYLKDVNARHEKPQEKTALDAVLDLEAKVIAQYKMRDQTRTDSSEQNDAYCKLLRYTQEKIMSIKITQEVLQKYINVRDNSEEDSEAIIRGMYSAALLEIICTTQPEKAILIDGKGKTFNYLFYHVKNASNVLVQNFKGNEILFSAGSYNGRIQNMICNNIMGNYLLQNIGRSKGRVKHITAIHIFGNEMLADIASVNGTAKYITAISVKGDTALAYLAGLNGEVEYVAAMNVEGKGIFESPGLNCGGVKHLIRGNDLDLQQKQILSRIEKIVESMSGLSSEEQKKAHDEIARLQTEIFAGEEK